MATFELPATVLSQRFNEDGDTVFNRQTNNQTLIIETSADDGFFRYGLDRPDPNDPTPLIAASLTAGNITAVELNGQRAEAANFDAIDLFVTRVVSGGETLEILTLDVETGEFTNMSAFVVLNDGTFPNIDGVARLGNFVSSATFSAITSGPFRPGARIDLADIPGVEFTETPITLGSSPILGTDGADVLDGTSGPDGIDGLGGNDLINGLGGADTIFGSGGADTINGGGGKDVIFGNGGKDELSGGGGRDRLDGNGGADTLEGGGGKDALNGGGGRDMLEGGGGKDVLTGGGGRDFFVFSTGDGADTITDFRDRQDRILIEEGADAFADLTISQVGNDARVRFANVTIDLEDTDIGQLSGADFIFG